MLFQYVSAQLSISTSWITFQGIIYIPRKEWSVYFLLLLSLFILSFVSFPVFYSFVFGVLPHPCLILVIKGKLLENYLIRKCRIVFQM